MLADARRENVRNVTPGVGAAGVHDAGARVAALAAEAIVEADAEAPQLGDAGRSLGRQELDRRRPADTAPRGERVGRMEGRIVVRSDRSGHASLGGIAVRARMRRLREHEHRGAGIRRSEGGREAGDTGSDDENVACLAFLPHKR